MSRTFKQLLSLLLCAMLLFGAAPLTGLSMRASAASLSEITQQYPQGGHWYGRYSNASECHGFALMVADMFYGSEQARSFPKHYDYSAIKPGDIIRHVRQSGEDGHTAWVIAVNGDTLTLGECNHSYTDYCVISWTRTITKSWLASGGGIYVLSAPYALDGPFVFDVNGWLDGEYSGSTGFYGTFDVWINNEKVKDDVWDFCESYPYGTSYRLDDFRPAEGKRFSGAHSGSTEGTITTDISVVLDFSSLNIAFWGISYSDNSDAGLEEVSTPVLCGRYKFWFKKYDEDSNYYINLFIDDQQIGDHLSVDSNGFVSAVIDTGNYGNGTHTMKAVLANTYGAYTVEKQFEVDNKIAFWGVSNIDSNDSGLYPGSTPVLCGRYKFWFKKYDEDSNYYINLFIDEQQIGDHLSVDSNGFISTVIDTGNYWNGSHTIKAVLANTNGAYTAEKDFEINNRIVFWGFTNTDNSSAGIDPATLPSLCGLYKMWFKKNDSDSNYYINLFVDDIQIGDHLSTDSDGFLSTVVDTRNYGDGAHTIKSVLANTNGAYCAYKDFFVNNKVYTVSWNANGGICSTASQSVYYNFPYGNLPIPTRTGYSFAGWYTAASGGTRITQDSTVTITGNQTLYAHWTPNTYAVKFNGNGATSGSMSNQSFTYDVAQNLTANAFQRKYTVTYNYNYSGSTNSTATATATFNGWATSADGAKVYNDKASVKNLATSGTYNLYANWTLGSITLPTPTRTGYTFAGWNTKADSTGTNYAAGTSYKPTANSTLYAKWTSSTYSVKFNGNGSTSGSMSNQSFTYDVAQNLTANAFKRAYTVTYNYNYSGSTNSTATATATFNGWATSADGAKVYNDKASVKNLATSGTYNLYANWTLGTVTLPTPTRTGYTFAGWNTKADGTGTNYAAGTSYKPTANVTLYAKWTANPPVITPVSGAAINSQTHQITGLTAGGTAAGFEQNYVSVSGGSFAYEYPTAKQVMGTGTKINVYNIEQTLVDTYTVVIFGDVDGDSWYDGTDAYFVRLVANGLIARSALTDAQLAACDANHDGNIDALDVALLEQAGLLLAQVDQTLPSDELQTNSVYLEYCGLIDQSIEIIEPEQPAAEQPAQTAEQPAAPSVWGWIKTLFTIVLNWLLRVF